jgi:hypothetical protein
MVRTKRVHKEGHGFLSRIRDMPLRPITEGISPYFMASSYHLGETTTFLNALTFDRIGITSLTEDLIVDLIRVLVLLTYNL